jgi:hypothetical protein
VVRSKGNAEIVDGSRFNAKIVQITMAEVTVTKLEEIISHIVACQEELLYIEEGENPIRP